MTSLTALSPSRRLLLAALCTLLFVGCVRLPWIGSRDDLTTRIGAHVEALRGPGHDALFPRGAEVTAVFVSPELGRVTVDFSAALLHQPVRLDAEARIAETLRPLLPRRHRDLDIAITAAGDPLSLFVPRTFGGEGPARDRAAEISPPPGPALVRPADESPLPADQGLAGRHIAMWPSHGWYFSEDDDRWVWQRPRMFTAVEDKLPMSFILPFLAPMLENAGAVALLPRERDLQTHEVIVDDAEPGVEVHGAWREASDSGFQGGLDPLPKDVNPHAAGTHRVADCVGADAEEAPSVVWIPDVPADGDYAVTVTFGAAPDRATDAVFSIRHAGGLTRRLVNQRMGGHMWVYLGTFSFRAGRSAGAGSVTLDARSSDPGATVSADAVRLGGGMGTVEMGGRVSGYPRFLEAATYWLQFAGASAELTYRNDPEWPEYTQDYAGRPEWVNWLRGAPNGPNGHRDTPGQGVPIDLSFAMHTDAGIEDGIIGSLMISMNHGEDGEEDTSFPDGRPRWLNRELGDLIQTQVVEDIRATISPAWTRRALRTSSYAEARRPNVPAALFELASHQNFDDQTSMLDPRFRFLVARAIYKGMLRWIATENDFEPVVQPLPPTHLRVDATGEGQFHLTWQPQTDPLEPTAAPEGYLVHHREGGPIGSRWLVARGGGFGEPRFTRWPEIEVSDLDPDLSHSFRVTAVNRGGESFPTPILAAAWGGGDAPEVLVVDAFDRIAPPHIVDIEGRREGFDRAVDRGVGFGVMSLLAGDQWDFDPAHPWQGNDTPWNNDHPGHGASLGDHEAHIEIGNLFDHTALHAESLHALGYTVHATTDEALEAAGWDEDAPGFVDWILGEERTTVAPPWAHEAQQLAPAFAALPPAHRALIAAHLEGGGGLLLSGAHWADDLASPDSPGFDEEGIAFLDEMLGVRWIADRGTGEGRVIASPSSPLAAAGTVRFETGLGSGASYGCEAPDLLSATERGRVVMRYDHARFGAAVLSRTPAPGRALSLGFPLECVADGAQREALLREAIAALASENEATDEDE